MNTQVLNLSGQSLIGAQLGKKQGTAFHGINPTNGATLEPGFFSASADEIDQAANLAADAFVKIQGISGRERAAFMRRIADTLTTHGEAIIQRANLESGLPIPRLQGELKRTTGQ